MVVRARERMCHRSVIIYFFLVWEYAAFLQLMTPDEVVEITTFKYEIEFDLYYNCTTNKTR